MWWFPALDARADCPDPAKYAVHAPVGPRRLPAGGSCTVTGRAPCGDHLVFVPSARRASWRRELFVFLPGSSIEPNKHADISAIAAYAGYRSIGLSYDSTWGIDDICSDV